MFVYIDNKNNRIEVTANEQFVSGGRTRWYIYGESFSNNKRSGQFWLTDERGLVKFFDTEKQAIIEIKNYLDNLISKGIIKEYTEE